MTDRRRKGSNAENNNDLQLWTALKSKLDNLNEVQSRTEESVSIVNALQAQWNEMEENASDEEEDQEEGEDKDVDDDKEDDRRELRERLMQAYSRLRQDTDTEKSLANEAMESLGILVALRAPEQSQPPAAELNKRKKRRLDNGSPAPSDGAIGTSSARNSPAPISLSLSRGGSRNSLSISTSSANGGPLPSPSLDTANGPPPLTAASASLPHSARSGSTASNKPLTKKERKAWLDAQLPLKEGRPVAFKPPGKSGPKGAKNEGGSTDWIQARVIKCIQGDKNRYEVQDVDDAEGAETKPGAIYVTTLKALLPLPDPRDRSTYPLQPYMVGSEVIALYPETTSFYRARIVSLPGNGKSPKYKLMFEEDNEEIKTVSVDHVVDPQDKN